MTQAVMEHLGRIKDAARIDELFAGAFLPRMHQLSDRTQTEAQLVPFVKAALAEIARSAKELGSEQQRSWYQNLCRRHLHEELARLSARAAQNNRQEWERSHHGLLDGQVAAVARWPADDRHFKICAETGLKAIADYYGGRGLAAHYAETAQAQFLSRVLTARLHALAGTNIAYAARLFDQHKMLLNQQDQQQMRAFLNRIERVVRAGILADAITKLGPPDGWLNKVPAVADHEQDGDGTFRQLLHDAVQTRVDEAMQRRDGQIRAERNALLRAVLERRVTRLETLLADAPALAVYWDRAEPETVDGVRRLMLSLCRPSLPPDDRARRMAALAVGHVLQDHPAFYRTNLAAARWNGVPYDQRLALIGLQDTPPTTAFRADHIQIIRRLLPETTRRGLNFA